ncbi:MAG: HEAT repeat domain-containing protein [Vicinamibacterales bacterium]
MMHGLTKWSTRAAIGGLVILSMAGPARAAQDGVDQNAAERQREREEAQRDRERERAERERERARDQRERVDDWYENAQDALAEGQWTRALERFARIVEANAARVDAAMYWTAYAQSKLGQQADALQTLAQLTKTHPQSRWIGDARALDIEVRRSVGQPVRPEAQADEELKLLAIQGLQHTDPAQAVPMLQKFLQGPQSPRLKERALFVLAQSNSAQARQVLAEIAKGATQPDLQRKAIQYLGVNATQDNRQLLADIYAASTDVSVKRQVLRAYMVAGDRARVVTAATGESSAELRQEAVRQLGVMGAREELRQLYAKESDLDVKRQILQALFVAGDSTRLVELANGEPNAELRLAAVRHLGTMGAQRTGTALVTLYERDRDAAVKRAVINALFVQGNAESLVALARKESSTGMKREMVQRLSLMKSKVATDYLMEILGK